MSEELFRKLEESNSSKIHDIFQKIEKLMFQDQPLEPEELDSLLYEYEAELQGYQSEMEGIVRDARAIPTLSLPAPPVPKPENPKKSRAGAFEPDFEQKECLSQVKYISQLKSKLDVECAKYNELKIKKISEQEIEDLSKVVGDLKRKCEDQEEVLLRTKRTIMQRIDEL